MKLLLTDRFCQHAKSPSGPQTDSGPEREG